MKLYQPVKKIILTAFLSFIFLNKAAAQLRQAELPEPLTKKESISGIGTDHTIYTTTLTIGERCSPKIAAFLNTDERIQSYSINDHQVDIFWKEATQENIFFFFEKLEFQYVFPCAR